MYGICILSEVLWIPKGGAPEGMHKTACSAQNIHLQKAIIQLACTMQQYLPQWHQTHQVAYFVLNFVCNTELAGKLKYLTSAAAGTRKKKIS